MVIPHLSIRYATDLQQETKEPDSYLDPCVQRMPLIRIALITEFGQIGEEGDHCVLRTEVKRV